MKTKPGQVVNQRQTVVFASSSQYYLLMIKRYFTVRFNLAIYEIILCIAKKWNLIFSDPSPTHTHYAMVGGVSHETVKIPIILMIFACVSHVFYQLEM